MAERSHSPIDGATGETCNTAPNETDATKSETRLKHKSTSEKFKPTTFDPTQETQAHRAVIVPSNSSKQEHSTKTPEMIDQQTGIVLQQQEENESRMAAEKDRQVHELESEIQQMRVQLKEEKVAEVKQFNGNSLEAEKQTILESLAHIYKQIQCLGMKVEKPNLKLDENPMPREQICQQDNMWPKIKVKDDKIAELNVKLQEQKQQTLIYQTALFIVIFAFLVYLHL